jgi:hypothetical protein
VLITTSEEKTNILCSFSPSAVGIYSKIFRKPIVFEYIWTPQLVYAVGLLATDGNLSPDGRHICMRSSDKNLLETYRSVLNLKNKIAQTHNNGYAKKPSYRIQFSNVQFYNWLTAIGVTPAKTHTIGTIQIPDEFFRDFLRGHLDGDGSITTYEDHYNTFKNPKYIYRRFFVRFISASEKHIVWLNEKANTIMRAQGRIHKTKPADPTRQVNMWVLKFGKKESISLLKKLYYHEHVPCLERKREIALNMFNAINTNMETSLKKRP